MSEHFDLDPDDSGIRALIRRSDGPVTVRPFRPGTTRTSPIAVLAGAAVILLVGVIVGSSLGVWRQQVASSPQPTSALPAPTAAATPQTPGGPAPVSAGAAPGAGVLYVLGADDLVYRYDSVTGKLDPITGYSTFHEELPEWVLSVNRNGSADLLRWDGTITSAICQRGGVIDVARNFSCAFREVDDSVLVKFPRDALGPHRVAPADWRVGGAFFDDAGSRLVFLRDEPGAGFEERGHNSLWLWTGGTSRLLYEPKTPTAYVFSPKWSPDGRWITVLELGSVSNSIAADGAKLVLIEVETGQATVLGTTVGRDWVMWSSSGELAFVRGAGRETWRDKRLVIRRTDGVERQIALPQGFDVQLAPAWSASGHLAFVYGPSASDPLGSDYMKGVGIGDRRGMVVDPQGVHREIRCPGAPLEGIRPSADGQSFLLLCRTPGEGSYPLSIWFLGPNATAPVPLVNGLGRGAEDAGGFGYYGLHPHLTAIAAWSLGTAAVVTPAPTAVAPSLEDGCARQTGPGPEPGLTSEITVCLGSAHLGDTLTVTGRWCAYPGGDVILYFGSEGVTTTGTFGSKELGRFPMDREGRFRITFTVPAELDPIQGSGGGETRPGTYRVYSKPSICDVVMSVEGR